MLAFDLAGESKRHICYDSGFNSNCLINSTCAGYRNVGYVVCHIDLYNTGQDLPVFISVVIEANIAFETIKSGIGK